MANMTDKDKIQETVTIKIQETVTIKTIIINNLVSSSDIVHNNWCIP